MAFSLLSQNPLLFFTWIVAVLVTVTIHEFAHAFVATLLGDRTPEEHGRLTFDPRAHIDMVGLLMLVLVGFGWGKPVPFNPYNLKFPRWGATFVSLAGPLSNGIALIVLSAARLSLIRLHLIGPDNLLDGFLSQLVYINALLMLFNLIPIPPLDGSRLLLELLQSPRYENVRHFLEFQGPMILIALVIVSIVSPLPVFAWLGFLAEGILWAVYTVLTFFFTLW